MGQIIKIDLGNEGIVLGRILKPPVIGFYDRIFSGSDNLKNINIDGLKFLFKIPVMNSAVKGGLWDVIGFKELSEDQKRPPKFFRQDAGDGKIYIYQEIPELAPNYERAATYEECIGLERAAVWEPSHVEDRLRDHFAHRPNRWVESLKLKVN